MRTRNRSTPEQGNRRVRGGEKPEWLSKHEKVTRRQVRDAEIEQRQVRAVKSRQPKLVPLFDIEDIDKGFEIITEASPCMWAHLHTPDNYKDKLSYKINLVVQDTAWWDEFERQCQALVDAYYADVIAEMSPKKVRKVQKAPVFKEEEDEDGNVTCVYVHLHMAASYKDKNGAPKRMQPTVIDSKKKPTKAVPYNGSLVRCKITVKPYFMDATNTVGVTMYFSVVQILELVEGKGTNLDGFEEAEGFVDTSYAHDDADTGYDDFDDTDDDDDDEPLF